MKTAKTAILQNEKREGDFISEFVMKPVGDQAILCEFGREIAEGTNDKVHALSECIKRKKIHGVTEVLPTYGSLLVFYNASVISYARLKKAIGRYRVSKAAKALQVKKTLLVPCLYGKEYGPDLEQMSAELALEQSEIMDIHQSADYKIYMLGFLPGFVYLGGLDKRIHMPRLDVPRTKIPAGSVGIGGNQTGVYPMESPGGWRLIGRTPLDFYNPDTDPPVLCHAGEYIRFVSITEKEYVAIRRDIKNGVYKAEYV